MSDEKTAIEKMEEWLENQQAEILGIDILLPIINKARSLLAEERARKPAESKARAYLEGLDDKKGG